MEFIIVAESQITANQSAFILMCYLFILYPGKLGNKASDFSTQDENGNELNLAQFSGSELIFVLFT